MMHAPIRVSRLACVLILLLVRAAPAEDTARAEAIRQAAARIAPCVVTIETIGGIQPGDTKPKGHAHPAMPGFLVADSPTTGLIWSADGLILTSSFNFVRDPSVITVVLSDGRRFVAELLARDEILRLAMLRIHANGLPTPEWADTDQIRVGQWAVSLGRSHGPSLDSAAPITGGCTLTVGIISGRRRISGLAIQTDAKLSPANFGGPLIDLNGRTIGMCVPLSQDSGQLSGVEWYDSGIGFAVSHDQITSAARDLAAGHNIRRGLLGIGLSSSASKAVVVGGMGDPSPAARAGIEVGDRITAIDDRPVETYLDLRQALRPKAAGSRVTVGVLRKNKKLVIPVILAVPEDIGPVPQPATQPPPPSREDDEAPHPPPSSGPA